ncbi:MAG: hypothetical protein PVJ02_07555 [Gemmatimonadota bacterium]
MSISPVVRRAKNFQDLLAIPGGDGPYVFTRMFRESDGGERRQSKRNFKLLRRVDGAIREIVEPGEKVLFLTEGRGFSFWERWVLGWRRAVVLTDRRAIYLQLDAGRRPRPLHWQSAYGAVVRVQEGRGGKVEVGTRCGDTLELRGLRRVDRSVVMDVLRAGAKARRGTETAPGLEKLCPRCHRSIAGRPRSCPSCLRDFRRGWLSALSSMAIPGLGSYLIGYRGFAVLELAMALTLWIAYLFGLGAWGLPDVRSTLSPGWFFGVVHGVAAVLAWHLTRRELFVAGQD